MKSKSERKETFEQELARLKEIVERFEREELPLEDSLQLYREGMVLVQSCSRRLESVEKDVAGLLARINEQFQANNTPE